LAALNHVQPDRVPVSLGGTAHKLSDSRTLALRQQFGLEGEPSKVLTGPSFGYYDTRLLDVLGTDVRHLFLRPPDGFRSQRAADGGGLDEWGLSYRKGELMYELAGTPLANATIDEIRSYQGPDPHRPELVAGLRQEARHLHETTACAIAAYRPLYSGIFEMAQFLRGTEANHPAAHGGRAGRACSRWPRFSPSTHYLHAAGDYWTLSVCRRPRRQAFFITRPIDSDPAATDRRAIKAKAPASGLLHSCGAVRRSSDFVGPRHPEPGGLCAGWSRN
jgi:hypothetical protein